MSPVVVPTSREVRSAEPGHANRIEDHKQHLVKSEKSGGEAVHKASALRKKSR